MPRKVKNPKLKQKQKQSQHVTVKVVNNIGAKRGGGKGGKRKRIGSAPRGGVSTGERAPVQFYQPLTVMPQLPHPPFEQPAQPPAFAAQDFTQQITNGIRDGLVNFAREAEQIRPSNDYYINQYTERPAEPTKAEPSKAEPAKAEPAKAKPAKKAAGAAATKRAEYQQEEFSYGELFPDTSAPPLNDESPLQPIRQTAAAEIPTAAADIPPAAADDIPPATNYLPRQGKSPKKEQKQPQEEAAPDALKQSADPEKDKYFKFTTPRAVQKAKDYMSLGGDRSLDDLAIDGNEKGKRSKEYRSGTGGAAATQKAPKDKPKSTFGSGR